MWRLVRWTAIAVGVLLVLLAIVAGAGSRTERLRTLVVATLSERLDSDVELEWFSVDTFPTVDIRGAGLQIRLRGAGDVPPLVRVERFTITGGIFGLLSRPRRFRTVALDGLQINIPPDRPGRTGGGAPAGEPGGASPILVDTLLSTDALLRIIPRDPKKTPKEFAIHRLEMTGVGSASRMPYAAELTNPLPRGQIRTTGHFGPWNRGAPGGTPLDGQYRFEGVDLSTIKGIAGTLTSTGAFDGTLERIDVKGETTTPDFRLAHVEAAMPLATRFTAVVDGTDGDTYLKTVEARLAETDILANGAVEGRPGAKGRTVRLDVRVPGGRIADLLRLSVRAERPLLTGNVALRTAFLLPPGREEVAERLRLDGAFDLSSAEFTNARVREKLAEMSSKASGGDGDGGGDRVLTDLEGRFRLAGGTLSFERLRFQVPGASVHLTGSYGLRSEVIDFEGTLRMRATISEAAGGGVKSVLLKIVDPLFRKKGAGAVLPIRVRGTRTEPKFGLDVVKAITPK